ncbi:MAG: hypothetical protein QOJ13_1551, partial [Gaiellales bacterium]|nr:hypothetical protein [Gaiellales bacterium]
MVTWGPSTNHPEHYARKVLEAAMYLHVTFASDQWLWRGQSQHKSLRPGMHSRVFRLPKAQQTEQKVRDATRDLISAARKARLDEFDGATLPDIALLSHLQHHGAATPLLDVTVDPLVALWMAANATIASPGAADDKTGYLFAIRQPTEHIAIMDARPHAEISEAMPATDVHWYRSPDVSERLRIQRGSFVLGRLDTANEASHTIPLREGTHPDWLKNRMARMGQKNPVKSQSDVFAIRIRGACKSYLRRLLAER